MNIIRDRKYLLELRAEWKKAGKKLVFTNGCFDILHAGHVDYLNKAKEQGDILLIALNSDSSVKRIKGEKRPVIDEDQRAFIMSNLKSVDYVTFFDEDTPEKIIRELIPDVLVKGEDWALDQIVGRDVVENNGGRVAAIKFVSNQSTSKIINKILEVYK
ncbi:MAG: D-glycero-beta-D-manno-heptose 1-phosphate adenylyltransferase [Bacteroidetes bacterium]|nr:D-glycero-beta-D-manno-heptose 1-phosphate adenylyltransferase [Bacteroidota bacterium]